jgi:hypothetical protein
MKTIIPLLALFGAATAFGQPALTIYNQNFAVVRDTVPLDLQAGVNDVRFADVTAQAEPDSVILRDLSGVHWLQILEQDYRNDPVSQALLLSLNEGKTIDFENYRLKDNMREIVQGKIIRSGYVPGGEAQQPIIEVNGKLRFTLPGEPLFPSLGDDTILKPTFHWLLQSDKPGKFDAQVGYITGGFSWEASYNLVAPENVDTLDMVGWITMKNDSGKTFENANIKLMAGDVNRIQPREMEATALSGVPMANGIAPAVTERAFDEFHLYTVARPTTLHDQETKQVEFVHAENIKAPVIYVYRGAEGIGFWGGVNQDQEFGADTGNKKVAVMREFVNAESNHLGMALPAGKLRFYRRSDDGQLEFTGEDTIDHTPRDETIRVTTGNAFDLVGERKQTSFHVSSNDRWMDESFEIKLRNHKKKPVEIRVVEPLYRGNNWTITAKSDDFTKTDAQTIEFRVTVKPDVEKTVTYTVHYTW